MTVLRILLADDQIPPHDDSEEVFHAALKKQFGDPATVLACIEQCRFMGEVVQALRDAGYRLTTARTYADAVEQIASNDFDLAIIDLGWYLDTKVPRHERPSAGWSLCERLDEKAARSNGRIPQILFSSRFPVEPGLSREAARKQKLPMFKQATPIVLNSLMAAVGFVEATIGAQRSQEAGNPKRFERELQDIALGFYKESIADYRRWTKLSLGFVAGGLVLVLAGAGIAFYGAIGVATLSSISSLICTTIAALLYRRLDSMHTSVETARREVLMEIQNLPQK